MKNSHFLRIIWKQINRTISGNKANHWGYLSFYGMSRWNNKNNCLQWEFETLSLCSHCNMILSYITHIAQKHHVEKLNYFKVGSTYLELSKSKCKYFLEWRIPISGLSRFLRIKFCKIWANNRTLPNTRRKMPPWDEDNK